MNKKQAWWIVVVYAIAMAWVESAVVVYLRTLIHRIDPYQPNPLPMFGGLGQIELGREAATLVMLLTVGWLAGRTWRSRLAYTCIAFGVWDIFYYILLVPMSGWPHSIFDWDILFLLPLPWWGPVIAPVSISTLLIVAGTIVTQIDEPNAPFAPRRLSLAFAVLGSIIALFVFMADAIRSVESIRTLLPTVFQWRLFIVALALMALPIIDLGWQLWRNRNVRRIRLREMRRTM
jgi:hypothetical protein